MCGRVRPTVNMLVKDSIERVLSTQVGEPGHGQPVQPSRLRPPHCPLRTRLPGAHASHGTAQRSRRCRGAPITGNYVCGGSVSAGKGHVHIDYAAHTTLRGLQAPQAPHTPGHEQRPRRGRHMAPPDRAVGSGLHPLGVNTSDGRGRTDPKECGLLSLQHAGQCTLSSSEHVGH